MSAGGDAMAAISPLAAYLGSFLGQEGAHQTTLLLLAVVFHWFCFVIPAVIVLGYLDTKLTADIQMRIGPNRVLLAGFFQFLADTMKETFKEDVTVARAGFVRWGPALSIAALFAAMGAMPVSRSWAFSNVEAGGLVVVFSLIFSNLVLFWSAYSQHEVWSVVSAFRVLALVGTYAVPLLLALFPPVLIAGGANMERIAAVQGGAPWRWIVFHNPGTVLSFAALMLTLSLWLGQAQRDNDHAASGSGLGFFEGYSGLRRGILSFAEYMAMLVAMGFAVTIYLGAWRFPFSLESLGRAADVAEWLLFSGKSLVLALGSIWLRASLPKMRSDQMIALSWKVLVPLEVLGIVTTAVWMVWLGGRGMGDLL